MCRPKSILDGLHRPNEPNAPLLAEWASQLRLESGTSGPPVSSSLPSVLNPTTFTLSHSLSLSTRDFSKQREDVEPTTDKHHWWRDQRAHLQAPVPAARVPAKELQQGKFKTLINVRPIKGPSSFAEYWLRLFSDAQASASKLLKETCSYIKSLHREVDDLSDRLSELMNTVDSNSAQAEIIRSLLRS